MPLNKKLRRKGPGKVWTFRVSVPGKGQREFSTGETDHDEALKVLLRKEAEIADGARPTRAASQFTLTVATELLTTDYELKERDTLDGALRKIKHLTAYFGAHRKLATIDAGAWIVYQRHRKQAGASAAEINREQAALHRMFVLGHNVRLVASVPHLQKLPERNRRVGFFEHGDYVRVRRHLSLALRPIFDLMYYTGWRLEEATGVQLRQVHEDGWIRLDPKDSKEESGKGVPYRQVPILARSVGHCLREHTQLQAEGILPTQLFVWWTTRRTARRGAPIKNWRGAFEQARVAAGVPGKLLHDLRRTAARNLDRIGIPQSTAMAITGHKTDSMWRRYNIQTESNVAAAFARDIQGSVRGSVRGSRTISGQAAGKAGVRLEVVSRGGRGR